MSHQTTQYVHVLYIAYVLHVSNYNVHTQDGSSLPVKQFQFMSWPEEGVPEASSGLIYLIGQVQKWQMNSGNKPIVVHCR